MSVIVVKLVIGCQGHRKNSERPHIILILADDLGWSDVGWRDSAMYTPTLDRLAQEGMILNDSYMQVNIFLSLLIYFCSDQTFDKVVVLFFRLRLFLLFILLFFIVVVFLCCCL